MEDILGFENQIGASFKRVIKRAAVLTPAGAAVTVAKKATAKKQPAKPVQPAKAKAMDKAIAKRIATGKPIPPAIKKAIDKRQATGKPLPPAIKQAVKVNKPIAAKRSVTPAQVRFNRTAQRTQLTRKQQAVSTKIVKRREATGKPIPVRALTKVTAPVAVKQATPVQRSYMPVDLPYQTIDKKTKPMSIPATKFKLPTSIDLVQPPVDAGTTDYYGK